MMSLAPRVLLISAPWRTPDVSNLGMATLRSILVRAGIETDELHGTHLFPAAAGSDVLRLQYSAFFFLPHLHPDVSPGASIAAAMRAYLDDYNLQGVRMPSETASFEALGLDGAALRRAMGADIVRAGICIERCVERAAQGYDVVGLSCTFEPQLPGALAIAARLKARQPEVRIVIGGAACFGEPAAEILKWSPAVDVVCHTEGDDVVVPLVRALTQGGALAEVPGITWRDGDAIRHNAAPTLLTTMDDLPVPDYQPFVDQLAASGWAQLPPKLYFETSRGCWWGEKHLCTFCGLNGDGLAYRRKSAERAHDEIQALYERYPTAERLYGTDNILDMSFFKTVLPRLVPLAQRPRPLRLFFEVKSNLKRDEVRGLAEAGVTSVQPGIESFCDDVLLLMDKGASGLGQIQHLKWLTEEGIEIAYNVLLANPGEQLASYRDMCELVPFLEHLPPPMLTSMWLERFSPYFNQPERHGIHHVRAKAYYSELCRAPEVDLDRLAYVFAYEHPMRGDAELRAAHRSFARLVDGWSERYRADTLLYWDAGDHVVILDRRDGGSLSATIGGAALTLFRYLDRVRTMDAIQHRFAEWPSAMLDGLLATWRRRRWVCKDRKGRHLAVIPRKQGVASPSLSARSADRPASLQGYTPAG